MVAGTGLIGTESSRQIVIVDEAFGIAAPMNGRQVAVCELAIEAKDIVGRIENHDVDIYESLESRFNLGPGNMSGPIGPTLELTGGVIGIEAGKIVEIALGVVVEAAGAPPFGLGPGS